MGRGYAGDRHDHLLRDLNEERAAALLRISKTLASLISQLQDITARVASGEPAPTDITSYDGLRQQALLYRWYLEVQREALAMRQHHALDEFYRVPGPLPKSPQ